MTEKKSVFKKLLQSPIFFVAMAILCMAVGFAIGASHRGSQIPVAQDEEVEAVDPLWFLQEDFDVSGYRQLHNDLVLDYSDVLEGEEIVTVAIVNYTMPGKLYASTHTGADMIGFEFDDRKVAPAVSPGDVITIAGVMSLDRRHGVTMKHCQIIGFGEIADMLKDNAESQRAKLDMLKPSEVDGVSMSSEVADQLRMYRFSYN